MSICGRYASCPARPEDGFRMRGPDLNRTDHLRPVRSSLILKSGIQLSGLSRRRHRSSLALAGQTARARWCPSGPSIIPRARGPDPTDPHWRIADCDHPSRSRARHAIYDLCGGKVRSSLALAGQTSASRSAARGSSIIPRARGPDISSMTIAFSTRDHPSRSRARLRTLQRYSTIYRSSLALAGQTTSPDGKVSQSTIIPRARGPDGGTVLMVPCDNDHPSRSRARLLRWIWPKANERSSLALAGQTSPRPASAPSPTIIPRARGPDGVMVNSRIGPTDHPSRSRARRMVNEGRSHAWRSSLALAGQT